MIKGAAHGRMLPLVTFGRKFLSPFLGPKSNFTGKNKGLNITLDFINPQKAHPCPKLHLLNHSAKKSVKGSDPISILAISH